MAALDYVRDLTCVSILAICVDDITCQLLWNNHSHKSIELGSDASPDSVSKKPMVPSPSESKKKQEGGATEPEVEHTMELQREEMVGSLHIARIHFQVCILNFHFGVGLTKSFLIRDTSCIFCLVF